MTRQARPFRAVVYLPGHGEGGALVKCGTLSAATEEGLARASERWLREGYELKAYEVLPLDLTTTTEEQQP